MKEYQFEYTNQNFTTLLTFICIFLFGGLVLGCVSILDEKWIPAVFAFGILMSFLIFWLFRKKLKKQGVASLTDDSIEFLLGDRKQLLHFENFASYKIKNLDSTILTINFKGDLRLKLFASNYFCKTKQFEILCNDLRSQIENYNLENHANIIRIKSFYEKKAAPYVLILLTVLLVAFIICARLFSGFFPVFLPAMIVFTPMAWINYFREQRKMKAIVQ